MFGAVKICIATCDMDGIFEAQTILIHSTLTNSLNNVLQPMKDLTHICAACPDYPRCNFIREQVYFVKVGTCLKNDI